MKIIAQVELLDRVLKEKFDYNVLSAEGRVLLSAIKNNGSMLKVIANSGRFSYRTAYNGIKKLESLGLVNRVHRQEDLRQVIIDIDTGSIVKAIAEFEDRS